MLVRGMVILGLPVLSAGAAVASEAGRAFHTTIKPLLERSCVECHRPERAKAGLDLTRFGDIDAVRADLFEWQIIADLVTSGEMPPESAEDHPSDQERAALAQWVAAVRREVAAENVGDPGPQPPRRLTAVEYDRIIADLTGVDMRPSRHLDADLIAASGYANGRNNLHISPSQVFKYATAAEYVASHLVPDGGGMHFGPDAGMSPVASDRYMAGRIEAFYEVLPVIPGC